MNFTVYVSEYGGNVWLSEDNQIRILTPPDVSLQQWVVKLNDDGEAYQVVTKKFDNMIGVMMFLLNYCGGDIHFTYEKMRGDDSSGVDRISTTWSKKDFSRRTLPRTDISRRKLLLP